jgi:type I restriction enzyme S subunit
MAMPEGWRQTTIGEVITLQRGFDITRAEQRPGEVPVVSSGGISSWHNRAMAKAPGVVIGRKGTLGRTYYLATDYWPHDTTLWVRDFKDNDPRFVYYFLSALRVLHLDVGSANPTLNRNHVHPIPTLWPPLEEQRRIAGVLGSLDDLIDVNDRIRSTLNRKGVALVEDLVVRQPDQDLVTLGHAARLIETGRRPRGGVRGIDDGVPSIGAESIDELGVFDFSKTKYVPADFAATMRTGVLESRDVLIYKDGGKPGDFRPHVGMYGDGFPFATMTINEHVYRVRAAEPLTEPYLYFWLSTETATAAMRRLGTGAAIPGLNSTALKSIPVAVAPSDVRSKLFPVLDALVGEALAAASEAHRLAEARDELLPLLLSGRVRVEEVAA